MSISVGYVPGAYYYDHYLFPHLESHVIALIDPFYSVIMQKRSIRKTETLLIIFPLLFIGDFFFQQSNAPPNTSHM